MSRFQNRLFMAAVAALSAAIAIGSAYAPLMVMAVILAGAWWLTA